MSRYSAGIVEEDAMIRVLIVCSWGMSTSLLVESMEAAAKERQYELNVEALSAGEYTLGHNVDVDYFAQDQYKELDVEARILDDLGTAAPRMPETELRSLLGCFLFGEDDALILPRRHSW